MVNNVLFQLSTHKLVKSHTGIKFREEISLQIKLMPQARPSSEYWEESKSQPKKITSAKMNLDIIILKL